MRKRGKKYEFVYSGEMMRNTPDDILKLLLELSSIPSVTGVAGAEDALVRYLYDEVKKWPYFMKNSADIWLEPLREDSMGRHNFCALVRAALPTKRTVILISHHDVVSADVFGNLSELAFNPLGYGSALRNVALPEEAAADLSGGEWLFGRGVSDMKGGMAVQLALLSEFAGAPEKLNANVLLMTLADEENNGFGVHQAVRMLARMQKEEGFTYLVCIDSEPTITNSAKENGRIYTGSIGNATLFALCVGLESHVGEYFQGINAAGLASCLIQKVEGDPATSDSWKRVRYSPATCLRLKDMSRGYSVTLLERVSVVFNFLTVSFTPENLMVYFKEKVTAAADEALKNMYARREHLSRAGYSGLPDSRYDMRVLTFAELEALVAGLTGEDAKQLQKDFLDTLDKTLESQDRGIELVNHMLDRSGLKGPLAVVGFLSPYCQSRLNRGASPLELKVLKAVNEVIDYARSKHSIVLVQDEVYEGISDMSEMGYQGTYSDLACLKKNLVGYGADLNHPFDEMAELDIPVINLGPVGKDAHKLTERVHLPFLLEKLPDLLRTIIEKISRH